MQKCSRLSITPDIARAIREVPHFRDSAYRDLDVPLTIDYYKRRFVDHAPLKDSKITIADIGCGFGWLAMAFAAYTDVRIVAVDADLEILSGAKEIASLLGLASRIDWRRGEITKIPLADREANITYCIEVLEHVYRDYRAFEELDRITREYLILTTPNGAFPLIMHDTQLPFCHWLPLKYRDTYARWAGREAMQQGNRFWYPWDLWRHLKSFHRVSRFFHFDHVTDYFGLYPYYLPYRNPGEWRKKLPFLSEIYFRLIALLGTRSYLGLHTLAGTFHRVVDPPPE